MEALKKGIIGIYKITSPSGKIYIGQSICIKKRWIHYSGGHTKRQTRIIRSFKKYGVENHVFEIVEECSFELLNERERYWQDFYDVIGPNGLNCELVSTTKLPRKLAEDSKQKISKALSGENHWLFGKNHSEKTRLKMSQSRKGEKHHFFGKQRSPEAAKKAYQTKLKNGTTNIGKSLSKETRLKMSLAHKGKKASLETRRKISEVQKLRAKQGIRINNKLVLNTETGIFYDSLKDAAEAINMNWSTFLGKMSGQRKNNTPFIYCN